MAKKRNKELAVNVGLFAISSFGSKAISFLLLPLYTAVLSTGDYGTVDLMNSTVSLLVPLFTLNIQDAVLRFGLGKDAKPEEIVSVGLRMVAAGGAVLLLIVTALFFSRPLAFRRDLLRIPFRNVLSYCVIECSDDVCKVARPCALTFGERAWKHAYHERLCGFTACCL